MRERTIAKTFLNLGDGERGARTLAVDLVAPTAPGHTAPAAPTVGEEITDMTPAGGVDIKATGGYKVADLPPGLAIDADSGVSGGASLRNKTRQHVRDRHHPDNLIERHAARGPPGFPDGRLSTGKILGILRKSAGAMGSRRKVGDGAQIQMEESG